MDEVTRGKLRALGQWIRVVRTKRGLTQEELAHRAGLDRSVMGAIERGEVNWGVLYLWPLAQALQTDIGDLFPEAVNEADVTLVLASGNGHPRMRHARKPSSAERG